MLHHYLVFYRTALTDGRSGYGDIQIETTSPLCGEDIDQVRATIREHNSTIRIEQVVIVGIFLLAPPRQSPANLRLVT